MRKWQSGTTFGAGRARRDRERRASRGSPSARPARSPRSGAGARTRTTRCARRSRPTAARRSGRPYTFSDDPGLAIGPRVSLAQDNQGVAVWESGSRTIKASSLAPLPTPTPTPSGPTPPTPTPTPDDAQRPRDRARRLHHLRRPRRLRAAGLDVQGHAQVEAQEEEGQQVREGHPRRLLHRLEGREEGQEGPVRADPQGDRVRQARLAPSASAPAPSSRSRRARPPRSRSGRRSRSARSRGRRGPAVPFRAWPPPPTSA